MTDKPAIEPRFARIWRGRTSREKADEYQAYWLANGISPLEKKGALGIQMFRDDGVTETEFVTISYWPDIAAMTGGSDADPTSTHHLDRDPEFLIELPQRVQVLSILETRGRCTIGAEAGE